MSLAQPSQGNWTVTGTQVVQNESITLNGNLTVENGGNLTVRNAVLQLNLQSNEQYGIRVEPGGSLYIYNSKISSEDGIHVFSFFVNGSNFEMEGSTLKNAGWCGNVQGGSAPLCGGGLNPSSSLNGYQGLFVETAGAVVTGNTINGSGIGLTVSGPNAEVNGNRITSSEYSSLLITSNQQGPTPYYNNDTVEGNYFYQSATSASAGMIILQYSGGNMIQNNTFAYSQVDGSISLESIIDNGGWGNIIRGNTVTSTDSMVLNSGASNNIIAGNSLTFCESGISFWNTGSDNVVENNTFHAGLEYTSKGHICGGPAIFVDGGTGLVVEGNLFSADNVSISKKGGVIWIAATSVQLVHDTNSYVLNNNITFSGPLPSFFLIDSSNNSITGNRFSKTQPVTQSIYLFDSNRNTINDNLVNASAPYSIFLDDSNNTIVYKNDFYGSAYTGGTNDSWTFEGVGNYWKSNCGGSYYPVPPDGTDTHPLASPVNMITVPVPRLRPATIQVQQKATIVLKMDIANDTTISGRSAAYQSGSISIEPGGHLTIYKSDLTFRPGGAFNINVGAGATLSIVDSNITLWTGGIAVDSSASATIYDSNVTVTGTPFDALVFWLYGGALTINSSTIQANLDTGGITINADVGVYQGNKLTILNSVLNGGWGSLDVPVTIDFEDDVNAQITIANSTLENLPYAFSGPGANSTVIVQDSTLRNMIGITWGWSANVTLTGNTLENAGDLLYSPPQIVLGSSCATSTSSTTTGFPPTTSGGLSTATTPTGSSGGGIPEFPFQLAASIVLVVVVVLSYILMRRRSVQEPS